MQRDYDIIYFTAFRWDHPYSSVSFSFAKEFVKNNRVFYINLPYTFKDFIGSWKTDLGKIRRADFLKRKMRYETIPGHENIISAMPPPVFPINFLPKGSIYDTFLKYNNNVILNTIKQVIKDYNIKKYIYINCYNPHNLGFLPKSLNPAFNVYQCIDDITQDPWTNKHGLDLENNSVSQAEITVVTSRQLKRLKSRYTDSCYILHNAADISIFEKTRTETFEKPKELANINTQIIGFTGNLDHLRINYGLLKKIAEFHKDKTLLLVGPINSPEVTETGLDKMPNVIFTGSKDIRILPQYLQYMDVTIIPFSYNILTASIYPLKINEYLATGRPVVSTNFSEDIRSFSDVIYLADTDDDFLNLINKAIEENDTEKVNQRVEVANTNTWTARVEQFWGIVEDYSTKNAIKKEQLI